MALTRPRAYQIYDIDYKQSVRVVAISNVTLVGGAPNSVDGVNLSLNDRILVTGQSTGSQNGVYYVTTVGTGSNGTWARSVDTNSTGELLSGTIVMVTEGTTYADTQWKLTTNDPITIGSTELTFVQNYLANSISYGQTSFAIGSVNANATISVAGTSNVAVFSTGGANITGNVSVGNIFVGGYYYANGTAFSGGGGTPGGANTQIQFNNDGVFEGSSAFTFNSASNIITATGNISGGNLLTSGLVSATGNITSSANISGAYILGNGSQLTGLPAGYSNSDVSTYLASGTNTANIITTGNVTGGNLTTAGILTVNSGNAVSAIVNGGGNGVGNIGSSTKYFNTVFAKATSAQYADVAEWYASDQYYEPGIVVIFDGSAEVTIATAVSDDKVAGVVSTNPAYIMNADIKSEYAVPVALTGRVPTRVIGPVRKGNMMISAGNGYAQACATPAIGTVIGKAIENFDGDVGVIEVVVGRL